MWKWGRDISVCSVLFPKDNLFWAVHGDVAQGRFLVKATGDLGVFLVCLEIPDMPEFVFRTLRRPLKFFVWDEEQ